MNALKKWVEKSREEAERCPQRYTKSYADLKISDGCVYLTDEELTQIVRYCGIYNGTLPTGIYLGKMFVRDGFICWYDFASGCALDGDEICYVVRTLKFIVTNPVPENV